MGRNCGIPVTIFIVFHFYLILPDLSVMLNSGLCSSPFYVIDAFAYYFLLLSFLLYLVLVFQC